MNDQQRIETAADNCEVLRARLARYEDAEGLNFQARVMPWLLGCFGETIASDTVERNHRFLEEALELVQACGCPSDEAHKLVDYVYGRPVGEKSQEVGGVMVTLAALCLAHGLDMHQSGETELARITQPAMVERIREKQKRKPAMSPLPGSYPERAALKAQHEQDAQTIKVLQAMARQLKAQPSWVVPELRQVVTDALIGMIAAVTSSTPPANEPPPPFIQAAIDRAVDRIARLNSSPVSAGDVLTSSECACGDQYPANSYGAGFMAANNGVCENCDASAPSHGEQVPEWSLAADELPSCGKPVLAYYLNSHGMGRRIRAMHVKRFTVEAEEFADPDTQCCEYSEQDDCYYTTEGWYELIDNWPDYSSCAVIEGVVTHWMPLPSTPSSGSQEQGE